MAFSARRFVLVLVALVAALVPAAPALATTIIPVAEAELTRGAVVIVVGHVLRIESHWDGARQKIFTDITLSIDDTLKGQLPVTEITLRQVGGRVAGLYSWIDGSPEFERGEKVLVFVQQRPDGTLRVAHLFQGKFSIITDTATGEEHVHRAARPGGVNVLGGGEGARVTGRLAEMKARIRGRATGAPDRRGAPAVITTPVVAASTITAAQESFTYLGAPSRWFEPDSGQSIPMRLHTAGEPLASGGGFGQVRAGYSAWNGVTTSRARFQDAGTTTAAGYQYDGVNSVAFGDPNGEIDPPSACSGTLAIGGYFRSDETKTVNGQSFYRILEGDIVFANGWGGCNFYESYANLSEVATHELGHVLGLGHSEVADVIMNAYAHLDGRGAQLGSDDIAGVSFMYPAPPSTSATLSVVRGGTGTGTVTSSPTGITCGADCSQSYTAGTAVTLTAAAASGSTFAGWSGGGCSGTGACSVTMSAATTVTATFNTSGATGGLTASFSAPAAGATVKGNVSVGMATNQWGTSKTMTLAVDGAVVTTKTFTGTTYWYTWNSNTVTNGTHTLKLTVSNASGSATATRSVIVANGTTPPSPAGLAATFTSPAASATVSGTTTVGMSSTGGATGSRTFRLEVGTTLLSTQTVTGTTASYAWSTTAVANGTQTLKLTVTDAGGATATTTRTVTVSNGTTPPPPASFTAEFTNPAAGATVKGTLSIGMKTSAPWGQTKTWTLMLDGQVLASVSNTNTVLWYYLDTRTVANGAHTLRLTVTYNGATATVTRSITVGN